MKRTNWFTILLVLLSLLSVKCKKDNHADLSNVFYRLYSEEGSYQTICAFQLNEGSYIIYAVCPEDNADSPVVIKTDLHGNLIKKNYLPAELHYSTIQKTSWGTMEIVGVPGEAATSIYVCEIDTDLLNVKGSLTEFPVNNALFRGPLMAPLFYLAPDSSFTIAFSAYVRVVGDTLSPALLHVNGSGAADPVRIYGPMADGDFMTRTLFQYQNGCIISGSSYHVPSAGIGNDVKTFILRLGGNLDTVWTRVLSSPDSSVAAKGSIPSTDSQSILLYGSQLDVELGDFQNSGISDMPGTLFTQAIDENGVVSNDSIYENYDNLAHAGGMISTSDGGYLMASTTNELIDFHVVSASRVYLLKLDASLHEVWHTEFRSFLPLTVVSVDQTSDGGYLVGCYEHSGTFHFSISLLKADASGNITTQ